MYYYYILSVASGISIIMCKLLCTVFNDVVLFIDYVGNEFKLCKDI